MAVKGATPTTPVPPNPSVFATPFPLSLSSSLHTIPPLAKVRSQSDGSGTYKLIPN